MSRHSSSRSFSSLTAATGDTNSAQVAAAILLVGWVQAASWTNQR